MVASDRKSHRIVSTLFGYPLTTCSVTQIAKFLQLFIRWFCAFMAGCGTMAGPSATQREPRRMKPAAIFQLARWHEERTGHSLKLLLRDEGIVLSQEMERY